MEALKIEILNPRAMKLIMGMQDLKLIRISKDPTSKLKEYLKKMRKSSYPSPDLEEIADIVKDVRRERYGK